MNVSELMVSLYVRIYQLLLCLHISVLYLLFAWSQFKAREIFRACMMLIMEVFFPWYDWRVFFLYDVDGETIFFSV